MYFFSQIDLDSKVPLTNLKTWIKEYTSYHILAIEHAETHNSLSCSLLFKSCSLTRTDKYTESLYKTLDFKILNKSLKSPSEKKTKIVTKIVKNWKLFFYTYLKKRLNEKKLLNNFKNNLNLKLLIPYFL